MTPSKHLIAVAGPTASGKSELALRLASAFDGEIVSADSRQVYRHMDAGTAKPTSEQRALVPHRLIDVIDPDGEFGLAQYLDLAREALDGIWRRGRTPFLVGGTGQYVWALIEGWQVPRVPPDHELRRSLEERAEREGAGALYRELVAIDGAAAARIDPRNVRRVVRALEVRHLTGGATSSRAAKLQPEFEPLILAIDRPRDELYRRIDERVDRMLESGLVDEVRSLLERGYGADLPPMSGIGYRQACAHLRGEMTLAEVAAKMKTESHRLARMQYTWFRRDDPRIHWVDASAGDPYDEAAGIIEAFLRGKET
ncbi:MAG TPA: tRNA (adenosine(37)-N6)-dimethylallyltransferase MiaA [Dehalococcoidia bacterium]|nr:tRNA (adenosine(37)-N6)-dimethylallyltransferase MiaA [Dehalococcoidia bacterium]